ncbi:formylglycine-generating enzyme family protein [Flagellimonas sediminis]|uniref:SUMF1/EgtB/PvdO family nonheme iron enzyme n=1 Tax=Flagellimonas sediminis TaxID=2696468 RepID=A0A6I5L238_9FLAO|nr:SUMF1/EgtB/PvdO family nonheme iron enzyme [Allomuricauda sediminis]NDV44198.1 SUMF1/EgtB/PvdO family nonheme iron enzyme [Allomuricauda sediminis]
MRTRLIIFTLLLSIQGTFAQNNLPVDMILVPEGFFGTQVSDSVTGSVKTHLTQEIRSFYMGSTEVSIQDFQQFCKDTGRKMPPAPEWGWGDPKLPIANVTYAEAIEYCNWLSKQYEETFTLPTPEQWEYAARSTNFDTPDFIYNKDLPNAFVVYIGNSREKPDCITCMQPNELGLYSMCGNVWEWTLAGERDPTNPAVMGGSFFEDANSVKVNSKKKFNKYLRRQDVGFRVVIN